jgi:hypothetical protein
MYVSFSKCQLRLDDDCYYRKLERNFRELVTNLELLLAAPVDVVGLI